MIGSTERPLRIALMIETDGPGGAEVVVIELARELRRRGHTVIAVGPDEGPGWLSGKLLQLGIERHTYHLARPIDPKCLQSMARMLRTLQLDVIHSHEFDMAFYGALAARWLGVRHVITMHGGDQVLRVARRRVALQLAGRISHATIAVSDHLRSYMEGRLPLLKGGRIGVVHNGATDPPADRGHARRRLELEDDEVMVLSVGSLRPLKGHAVLLRAMGELALDASLPRWRVLIAGQGDEHDPLARLAADLGIADRVELLGQREDIPDLQAAADIYAMPSHWEGLPMAILEAMFGACPIVASDVGGISEAVTEGLEGRLVEPGDPTALAGALRPLIEDRALRERMGRGARARAIRDFGVSTMADRYERLYRGGDAGSGRPVASRAPAATAASPDTDAARRASIASYTTS